ncbi:two-component system activity regulator YycH, partial [Staphylococcus epidermidis]|uniref:two-component system activity regulator YycH n=1 Tax=Staphylococcus epidermidis TaxID=1282 RepID=UPI001C92FAF0
IIQPLKNQQLKSLSHLKTQHNLLIPQLTNNFILLHFTYHFPLSTYLTQVLHIHPELPNNFNFHPLLIHQHHNNHLLLFPITKHPHQLLKLKTTIKPNNLHKPFK